jgi:hypothetical protein
LSRQLTFHEPELLTHRAICHRQDVIVTDQLLDVPRRLLTIEARSSFRVRIAFLVKLQWLALLAES